MQDQLTIQVTVILRDREDGAVDGRAAGEDPEPGQGGGREGQGDRGRVGSLAPAGGCRVRLGKTPGPTSTRITVFS